MRQLLFLSLLFLSACATQPKTTLYEDLGGASGVDAIVDNFIHGLAADPEIFPYFADSHVSRFREKITEHMCSITDGPCTYTGDNMVDIHVGMHITENHFNRVVDILYNAMDKEQIPHRIQNRLIARLAPLRQQIIYR